MNKRILLAILIALLVAAVLVTGVVTGWIWQLVPGAGVLGLTRRGVTS